MWSGRYTHERPKDDHALKFRPVAGLNWEFRPKKTLNPLFFYYTTVVHSFLSLLCDLSLPAGCSCARFQDGCSAIYIICQQYVPSDAFWLLLVYLLLNVILLFICKC
ncbi:hypothetical protein P8452_18858 [Trifolium repens]|nr:hypothetical protein P8452_18858 [Trifolium repens]